MPYADSFISRDNALYALDIRDQPRSYDEFNFAELTDWSNTNSSVTIVLDNREYPLFYVFKILPSNANTVTFQLDNVTIGGVNVTNLNNMELVGHALVKCSNSITVNTTINARSTITSHSISASHLTSINPDIQTAVRSGSIIVNRNKSGTITSAYGNGSYVTYYSKNSYSSGESVLIFGTGLSSFNYESTPATVQYATPQMFTVSNNTVGYVQPTSSYSYLSESTIHQMSQPFKYYSGENLTASLLFSFSGHGGDAIYLTIPVIADMNRIFSSWATQMTLDTTPQVYREIDEVSSPTWPMARLIHSLTAGVEDIMDKYAIMARTDPTVQAGFVDVTDSTNKSYLVDPDIALPKYYDWLLQFIGQTRSYSTISSNKCADYRATIKVRCATTSNVTIADDLQPTDSIDGVALADGDRVLVKNQTNASQNGIYVVSSSPARWSGMPAASASISSVSPVTPSLGYAQLTTSAAHGFAVGDAIVVAGITPSGYNGQYIVHSIPSTTTFVIETTQVASATVSSATAKRAVDITNPDLIFVREGTVNKMTMWSPSSASWPVIGTDSITFAVKQVAAKLATTSNITIADALLDALSIDGVVLATGDYVLVKNQTIASQNGVYEVAAPPVRISNLPATTSLLSGFRTYVWGSGTQNTETMFTLDDDGVVGTDSLEFTATVKPFAWDDSDDFKLWQLTNKYFGYKAGTIESIRETVKRYLIGEKTVVFTLNPPFEFVVYTLRNETPGIYYTSSAINTSELITNAISIIKPMGFNVTHTAVETLATFIIGTSTIGTGPGDITAGRLG
jgi:hypothetical protein